MSTPAVHIRDEGTGPPVVFLHAFPLDSSMWDPQVASLRGHHRCLRPDFWGCGQSPPPAEDHSLEAFAATVLEQLARLGVPRFAVVGLSMGGYVAFAMLRQAPERITKVVLAGTRATADSDEARADRRAMASAVLSEGVDVIAESMLSRLLSVRGSQNPELTALVRQTMLNCSPAGVAACQDAMAGRPDSTALLSEIRCPVRMISGAEDGIVTTTEMRAMAALIPPTKCNAIEDAGHLANLDAPGVFTDLMDGFLDAD